MSRICRSALVRFHTAGYDYPFHSATLALSAVSDSRYLDGMFWLRMSRMQRSFAEPRQVGVGTRVADQAEVVRYPKSIGVRFAHAGRRRVNSLAVAAAILMAVVCNVSEALAQSSSTIPPMFAADYVPSASRVLVHMNPLNGLASVLGRSRRLLSHLSVGLPESGEVWNLTSIVRSALGVESAISDAQVLGTEMAIATPGLSRLNEAVWFLHLPREVDRTGWFSVHEETQRGVAGQAQFFATRDGRMIGSRDHTMVVARRWGPGSLFADTLSLMAGREGAALSGEVAYQAMVSQFPPGVLASVYVAPPYRDSSRESKGWLESYGFRSALFGLAESDGIVQVLFRAQTEVPSKRRVLSRRAIEQIMRLPQTTVLAVALAADLEAMLLQAGNVAGSSVRGRLGAFLADLSEPQPGLLRFRNRFGANVVLAWGQDLREGYSTPQLAAFFECGDVDAARAYVTRLEHQLVRLVKSMRALPGDTADVAVQEDLHLGVSIRYLSMGQPAQEGEASAFRLVAGIEPAWTIADGWLIVALTRDHLKRILDAQTGMFPPLGLLSETRRVFRHADESSAIALFQSGLAGKLMESWLAAFDAGAPSLLDPKWWRISSGVDRTRTTKLGIGMKVSLEPGAVVVARVYPYSTAANRLKVHDRIIGIDGQLLAMKSPNRDLRRRWRESEAQPGPTLRVDRKGKLLDITLPRTERDALLSKVLVAPAEALRQLAALTQTVDFATLETPLTESGQFAARLSLRFPDE